MKIYIRKVKQQLIEGYGCRQPVGQENIWGFKNFQSKKNCSKMQRYLPKKILGPKICGYKIFAQKSSVKKITRRITGARGCNFLTSVLYWTIFIIYLSVFWSISIYLGLSWPILAHLCPSWLSLVNLDLFRFFVVNLGQFWFLGQFWTKMGYLRLS